MSFDSIDSSSVSLELEQTSFRFQDMLIRFQVGFNLVGFQWALVYSELDWILIGCQIRFKVK